VSYLDDVVNYYDSLVVAKTTTSPTDTKFLEWLDDEMAKTRKKIGDLHMKQKKPKEPDICDIIAEESNG
jgi:hypothetical protein